MVLQISNLTKTYKGGVKALRGINLNVEKGDFYALLGPNGAGKTTTIGIISSLVNKSAGDVKIMGMDLYEHPMLAKSNLGIVPQEININSFEKVENIVVNQAMFYGISRKIARLRTVELLKKTDLYAKRKNQVRQLSGGMKRRLMIARALVSKPKVLLLDEPTAGVDVEIRAIMWDFLRKLNKEGMTILLTTHNLEEAENLCNKVAIIDHGQIIEDGNMTNVLGKLECEVFVLYLEKELQAVPNIEPFISRLVEPKVLEVVLQKGQSINDLFALLSKQNVTVSGMRNKANRLEQLFMNLVRNKK